MWLAPLLAPVSTVGKPHLVVVAVQGAPCSLLLVLIYLIRDHHRVGLFTKTRVGARMAGDRSRWSPPSINQIASDATNQDADSMLQNTLLIEESNSADV